MKWMLSPNRSVRWPSRCDTRWSRSTWADATPNSVATASRSSASIVFPSPRLRSPQRGTEPLFGGERTHPVVVGARMESRDGRCDVDVRVAESRAVCQIEDGLFGSGHHDGS